MAGPVSTLPAASTPEFDSKRAARSSFNGAEASKMTVQEMLDSDPTIVRLKDKIEKSGAALSKETKKMVAFQNLADTAKRLSDAAENLMGRADKNQNAFDRSSATITTTDTSEGHISVSVKPGTAPTSFTVNVAQLATQNKIILGTANIDLATAVNVVIQAAAVNGGVISDNGGGDFLTAIRVAAGPLSNGVTPINSYAKDLYLIAKKTFDASTPATAAADLAQLKLKAEAMFGQMQLSPISAGLATLDTPAVGVGALLNVGEYTLYSGEGGLAIAQAIKGVAGVDANAVKRAAHDAYDNLVAAGDERRNDPLAKYVLKAIDAAAAVAGATAQNVIDAANAAYNEYKAFCHVSFVDGDRLQQVIDKINNTTKYSGVTASSVSTGNSNFVLRITAKNTGILNNIEFFNNAEAAQNIAANVVSAGAAYNNKTGQGSIAYIDNIPQLSNYNTITHGGADITLRKLNTNIDVEETVVIGADLGVVAQNIIDFQSCFEELSLFLAVQTERDGSTYLPKDTAVLCREPEMEAIRRALSLIRSTYIADNDEGFRSLADIGISFIEVPADAEKEKPAHLAMNIDTDLLMKKLKDPLGLENIRRLFEFSSLSSNPAMKVLGYDGSYGNIDFRVSINQGGFNGVADDKVKVERMVAGAWVPEYYNLGGVPGAYTIDINDPASPLNGLLLTYASNVNVDNITIKLRQGCCDRLYNDVRGYLDQSGELGLITKRQQSLGAEYTRKTKDIEDQKKKLQQVTNKRADEIATKLARASKASLDTQMMEAYLDGLYGPK